MIAVAWLWLAAAAAGTAVASEYPERECCDPVNAPPASISAVPNYAAAAAAGQETGATSPAVTAADSHRGKVARTEHRGACVQ